MSQLASTAYALIGLGKLIEAIARCTLPGGELVALVKPQFEAGRECSVSVSAGRATSGRLALRSGSAA